MANNRAQVLAKETTVPDGEETSTAWIGKALADQNAKIEKNTADMFAAIRMISEKVDLMANGSQSPVNSAFDVAVKSEPEIFNVEVPRRARSGLQPQYSGVTRLAKLDFPRFGGDRVKDWLFRVEQFFSLELTPDDFKVRMCSIHFDGPAAAWHQSLYDTDLGIRVMNDWVGYKRLLMERFDEVLDDPIAELKNLQETNGIKEYHEKFEVIRLRLRLPEDYLVRAYLAGLKTDTQMHIRMFQPDTISKCLMLGRLYETAHPTSVIISTESDDYQKGVQPLNVASKAAGTSLSNIQVHNFSPKDNDFSEGKQSFQQESYVGVKKLLQQNVAICATESISQSQVPILRMEHGLRFHNASPAVCADSQYVVGFDDLFDHQNSILQVSYVKARDVLLKNSTCDTNNQAAHHMFDTRPLKVQSKRRHMKCSKSWRFKFKQRRPHKGRPRNAHKRIYRGNVKYKHRVVPRNFLFLYKSSTEYPCLFLTSKVVNHTPFSLDKLGRFKGRDTLMIKHFLLSDGRFQIKHKWRFKLLPSIHYDDLLKEPERVLERKMVNRQGRAATMVFVKWTNQTVEEATWEYLFDLIKKFPAFEP